LGRICLRAFEETGYWFERDWQIENWGTNWIQDFEVIEQTTTSFEATFATPWSPADKLYSELAKRFPELRIEVSATEEGASFSCRFSSHDGEIRQEWLTENVVGERIAVDPIYLLPARLQSLPLTHIRHWFSELRITLAVDGYPIYRPPPQGIEIAMSEREATENFEYFMSQRATRIAHLRDLLARFGVAVDSSEQTKRALDMWIFRYGGFLYVHESGSSFLTHNPRWNGARAGLNVIFDLAVFLGEFAIGADPGLRWEMFTDMPSDKRKHARNYRKPIICGLRGRIDMMRDVHQICRTLRENSYMWQKPGILVGRRKLCAEFASRTLMKAHRLARGDLAGARRALTD
jgi:hypothetical protein